MSILESRNGEQSVSQSNLFSKVVNCCEKEICEKNQWQFTDTNKIFEVELRG